MMVITYYYVLSLVSGMMACTEIICYLIGQWNNEMHSSFTSLVRSVIIFTVLLPH